VEEPCNYICCNYFQMDIRSEEDMWMFSESVSRCRFEEENMSS
jgi:hypothetical protein